MISDVPKLPKKPEVLIEQPINQQTKNPLNQPARNGHNFGGIFTFTTVSGTASGAASGASLSSIVPSYQIGYTPHFGILPSEEIKKQYVGDVMSWIVEIKPPTLKHTT